MRHCDGQSQFGLWTRFGSGSAKCGWSCDSTNNPSENQLGINRSFTQVLLQKNCSWCFQNWVLSAKPSVKMSEWVRIFTICTIYITIVMMVFYGVYEHCSCPHHVGDHTPLAEINVEILSAIIQEYKVPVWSGDLFENLIASPIVFHQQLLYNSTCTDLYFQ